MTAFSWAWLILAVIVAVAFGVIETMAFKAKGPGPYTLTSNVQAIVRRKRWFRDVSIGLWVAFGAWWLIHLYT